MLLASRVTSRPETSRPTSTDAFGAVPLKGAANARTDKAGTVTRDQARQIAETKMPDLNAIDPDGALAQVAGTARSMGIEIVD